MNEKKETISYTHLQKNKGGGFSYYKLVGLRSVFRKIVKQILLKCFGNQNRKVIGILSTLGHLGLIKVKWLLTTLIAIYEEVKSSVPREEQWMLFILTLVNISEWISCLMSDMVCMLYSWASVLWNISTSGLDVKWSTPALPGTWLRDLKLKKLAARNFRHFKIVKCKTLHMGSNNPMQWCKLKTESSGEATLLKKARSCFEGFKTFPPA